MQAVLSPLMYDFVNWGRKVRTTKSTVLLNGKVPPLVGTASATENIPPCLLGQGKGEKAR